MSDGERRSLNDFDLFSRLAVESYAKARSYVKAVYSTDAASHLRKEKVSKTLLNHEAKNFPNDLFIPRPTAKVSDQDIYIQPPQQAFQVKCLNTSALAAAVAVKSCNNEVMYQDILTVLGDATNDLSKPCHDQRIGADNGAPKFDPLTFIAPVILRNLSLNLWSFQFFKVSPVKIIIGSV